MLTLLGNEHQGIVSRCVLCGLTGVGRPTLSRRFPSLPPPWLKQTNERCAAGKPTEHTEKQELDRCWSGTGLESPFSDSALPCQHPADRSRQIFLTLAASLGFQTHKGDVKYAFLQGNLDERVDDDDNFNTFCEPVPELSRQLQLEHHQCIRLLKAVHVLGLRL